MTKILSVLTSKIALWVYVGLSVIFIGASVYLTYTGYTLHVIEHVSSIAWVQAICFGLLASIVVLLIFVILQIVGISFEFKVWSLVLASCFLIAGIASFLKIVPPTNTADQTEQVAENTETKTTEGDQQTNQSAASDQTDDNATDSKPPSVPNSDSALLEKTIAEKEREADEKQRKHDTDSIEAISCSRAKKLADLQRKIAWYDNNPVKGCDGLVEQVLQKKSNEFSSNIKPDDRNKKVKNPF